MIRHAEEKRSEQTSVVTQVLQAQTSERTCQALNIMQQFLLRFLVEGVSGGLGGFHVDAICIKTIDAGVKILTSMSNYRYIMPSVTGDSRVTHLT